MKTGIELIAEERERQVQSEGYSPEHDDAHTNGEIADAAVSYCSPHSAWAYWPWEKTTFKPSSDNRIRELTKAGALIAAEIDRLQRLQK